MPMAKLMESTKTFGPMADSFYEYMLKIWIQGGQTETQYREMYDKSIQGMHDQLLSVSTPSELVFIADQTHLSLNKSLPTKLLSAPTHAPNSTRHWRTRVTKCMLECLQERVRSTFDFLLVKTFVLEVKNSISWDQKLSNPSLSWLPTWANINPLANSPALPPAAKDPFVKWAFYASRGSDYTF